MHNPFFIGSYSVAIAIITSWALMRPRWVASFRGSALTSIVGKIFVTLLFVVALATVIPEIFSAISNQQLEIIRKGYPSQIVLISDSPGEFFTYLGIYSFLVGGAISFLLKVSGIPKQKV